MLILVTGPMAAGKSTVAQTLAEAFPRSVHLRGDVYRRMVVSGREDMSSAPSDEARRQLKLRYELARDAACTYLQAGFTVVYQDTIVGPVLSDVLRMYRDVPVHLVVLSPSEEAIRRREEARSKKGYHRISIEELHTALGQTPRVGLWVDNSQQSVEQTVRHILDNLPAARVGAGVEWDPCPNDANPGNSGQGREAIPPSDRGRSRLHPGPSRRTPDGCQDCSCRTGEASWRPSWPVLNARRCLRVSHIGPDKAISRHVPSPHRRPWTARSAFR